MPAKKEDVIGAIRSLRAPWSTEGALAGVIIDSIGEHFMTHVRDLTKVVA